jgi:hypothetical protein
MRENEVKTLEEQLKTETDSEEREKIKIVLQRLVIKFFIFVTKN